MMDEPSLSNLQDDLKVLIIEKVVSDEGSRTSLRNISEVGWDFRRIVFSRRFQCYLSLYLNSYKLPYVDVATISFIRRLHEERINHVSLFFGIYKFFYEQNYDGLPILEQVSVSSIGEAVYAYGIALLCNGQYYSGIDELRRIWYEEDGRLDIIVYHRELRNMLGPEWFENIRLLRFCVKNNIGHWASMDPYIIYGYGELDITCERCMLAVELFKLAMPLGWDTDLGINLLKVFGQVSF